jgi:hypothetical protein
VGRDAVGPSVLDGAHSGTCGFLEGHFDHQFLSAKAFFMNECS